MKSQKVTLFAKNGSEKGTVEVPSCFSAVIRDDLAYKAAFVEASNARHPYGPDPRAGRKHSASGRISHQRHHWGGHYGKGISRIPRKTMWRRGTQFFWVGAEISGTRGGRKAHAPHAIVIPKNFNKKELKLALVSAISATASEKYLKARYSTLTSSDFTAPAVIESLPEKTKDFISAVNSIFKSAASLAFRQKAVRAGAGKRRNRKYKQNAGLLVVIGKDEAPKLSGVEYVPALELSVSDLYPLGRLTLYTQKALSDLNSRFGGKQ